jgi:hypothetical protein
MKSFSRFLVQEKTTLEYHDTLNEKLWKNDTLHNDVRKALLRFADAWADFANIPKNAIEDIIMTGGNANFNYTPTSDIDVHLIVDKSKIGPAGEMLDDYLYDKKLIWTLTHKIKVLGYDLEPYAQDKGASYPENQGVYSLKNNKWVAKPKQLGLDFENDKTVQKKADHYEKTIDHMIKHKMALSVFEHLRKEIRDMRNNGIAKGGEFAPDNLVFKELRNRGALKRMDAYESTKKDQDLSL